MLKFQSSDTNKVLWTRIGMSTHYCKIILWGMWTVLASYCALFSLARGAAISRNKEERERRMFSLPSQRQLHQHCTALAPSQGPVQKEQCDRAIREGSGMGEGGNSITFRKSRQKSHRVTITVRKARQKGFSMTLFCQLNQDRKKYFKRTPLSLQMVTFSV